MQMELKTKLEDWLGFKLPAKKREVIWSQGLDLSNASWWELKNHIKKMTK